MSFPGVYFWLLSSSLHARMRHYQGVTQWRDEANAHYGGHRLDVTIRIDVRRCEGVFILLYQRMLHPMSLTGIFQLTPNAISFRQGSFFLCVITLWLIIGLEGLRSRKKEHFKLPQINVNIRHAQMQHIRRHSRGVYYSLNTLSHHIPTHFHS